MSQRVQSLLLELLLIASILGVGFLIGWHCADLKNY